MPPQTIAVAALLTCVSIGYAVFISRWLVPRITPAVPPVRAVTVAVLSALLTAAAALWLGDPLAVTAVAAHAPIFVTAAIIDQHTKRIPNALVVQAIAVTVPLLCWAAASDRWAAAAWAAGLSVLVFGMLLALNVFSRGGFGMGDVKLGWVQTGSAVLAVTATWTPTQFASPVAVPLLLIVSIGFLTLSFISGGLFVLAKRLHRARVGFPFGPHLVIGWVAVLALAPFFLGVASA